MTAATSHEPAAGPREGGWCYSSLLLLTDEDLRCVYPDDLPAARQKYPGGWQLQCFQYAGRQGGYHVLDDGELRMRVREAIIQPIPAPRFRRGDRVFAYPKQVVGVVRQVSWHLKRGQVYYSLIFGTQPSGRWYFESDLDSPSSAEPVAAPDPAT